MKKFFTKRNIVFISIFAVAGFLALQVPLTTLVGSKVKFTLFDLFGPIATGFIGLVPGLVAVFLMQFANFLVHGAKIVDAGTVIRFFPMLFAAAYFGKKHWTNVAIPLVAMAAFAVHPIGRTVWYFGILWTIPLACYFLRDRFLVARALGATFSAHAVGGALWIWAFNLPAPVWVSLIPVVLMERGLFALGIAASYVVVTNLVHVLVERRVMRPVFSLEKRYLFGWLSK